MLLLVGKTEDQERFVLTVKTGQKTFVLVRETVAEIQRVVKDFDIKQVSLSPNLPGEDKSDIRRLFK